MLFTGFKLRTPTGYLSESEQEALIVYVLARAAVQPTIAHEVQLVLDGEQDACDLSASTLGALRHLADDFIAAQSWLRIRAFSWPGSLMKTATLALVATVATVAQFKRYLDQGEPLSKSAQTEVDGLLSGLFKK